MLFSFNRETVPSIRAMTAPQQVGPGHSSNAAVWEKTAISKSSLHNLDRDGSLSEMAPREARPSQYACRQYAPQADQWIASNRRLGASRYAITSFKNRAAVAPSTKR